LPLEPANNSTQQAYFALIEQWLTAAATNK
jgi:hypothetical protein